MVCNETVHRTRVAVFGMGLYIFGSIGEMLLRVPASSLLRNENIFVFFGYWIAVTAMVIGITFFCALAILAWKRW